MIAKQTKFGLEGDAKRQDTHIRFVAKPLLLLDIDGVLLLPDASRWGYRLAPDAVPFLSWAASHFELRWLSQRCQDGHAEEAWRALRLAGLTPSDRVWGIIKSIPARSWTVPKVSAINCSEDFFWIDDRPDEVSLSILAQHGLSERLIIVGEECDGLNRCREMLIARITATEKYSTQ